MEKNTLFHHAWMKFILPLSMLFLTCNTGSNSKPNASPLSKTEKTTIIEAYKNSLQKVDSMKAVCKAMSVDKAGIAFAQFIDRRLVPYWIGTPWDFNGITQTPNEGMIACGYLVTTILRDAGVSINRVKQAQCASEQMINSMTHVKENYSRLPFEDFIKKVKAKGPGISIIGLDNHTGFLYCDGSELYFIHSSYVGEGKVAKEIAADNSILQNSHYKVVGYISKDPDFIKKWISGN